MGPDLTERKEKRKKKASLYQQFQKYYVVTKTTLSDAKEPKIMTLWKDHHWAVFTGPLCHYFYNINEKEIKGLIT